MKFVLASRNANKIREVREWLCSAGGVLQNAEILSLDDIGLTDEIEETGNTFAENALLKAAAPAAVGYIGIADDSGLTVDALDGAPGIYSARYAEEGHDDRKNNAKLLREMEHVSDGERGARYVCAIACVFPDGRRFSVEGSCKGTILRFPCGDGGFGYDPLFWSLDLEKTFAEADPAEKNHVSHRARALQRFARKLQTFLHKPQPLGSKARAYLRSLSNAMQPIFQIGKGGISGEMCKQINNALEARELIKVSVLDNCIYTPREAAEMLAESACAAVVSVTGRKFVLYRESAEKKGIVLP